MCLSPSDLGDGLLVGCRRCWQCRSNYVSDWVGRNIAETETATVSYAVTLTYGRSWDGLADHLRSVMLTYSDVQKMLKRMRKAGYIVRYIVTGEYGPTLGRAHWHGVFHFYGSVLPEWEGAHLEWTQEQWDRVGGIHIDEWAESGAPIGHVHIKKATYAHTRYAMKYLLKEVEHESKLAMSRKPPLGYAYFIALARETVQRGVVPQDLVYRFRVRTMAGEEKLMPFLLRGRMAELFLETVIAEWKLQHGNRPRPPSELVDTYDEFGRLGREEWLTETRVEDLPGERSIFRSDGTLYAETHVDAAPEDEELDYDARLAAQLERARLRRRSAPSIIRSKADWVEQWVKENGDKITEHERDEFERQYWVQARSDALRVTGLTLEEFNALSASDRQSVLASPGRFASIVAGRRSEARRRDNLRAEAARKRLER